MKRTFITLTAIIIFCSCDPIADMEANIKNLTNQDLIIEFVSFDQDLSKTLVIPKNETRLFESVYEIGNTFLEPRLIEYDSVVVKNNEKQILKVYKPNDIEKNIYNIEEYWLLREPSKRFFKYEYEINNEDLE
ncbi:hypothetical protein [Belliella aquatica]|nr:hypothetical protein [Belliella aquatica]MCH7407137.1 hypothetical protein [Belliella aquatica]